MGEALMSSSAMLAEWTTDGFYRPWTDRRPDQKYQRRLRKIISHGTLAKDTPQGVGAHTCFGTLAPMVFNLANGVPLITERRLGSWRMAVGEIIAFINGARTIDEIESYGCGPKFWGAYRGMGTNLGLANPNDMGPGSYGAVFHDYERADGTKLNQFAQVIEQIRRDDTLRTHRVTNWRPDYTAAGPERKVIIAPCHGELHFRVLQGRLHMRMDQRSADFPVGVPHNMIQYAALHLMMCQVTSYPPGNFVHSFSDAHVYENQVEAATEMLRRVPKRFPVLLLEPWVKNLFDFRIEHFTLKEYEPNASLDVPFAP